MHRQRVAVAEIDLTESRDAPTVMVAEKGAAMLLEDERA